MSNIGARKRGVGSRHVAEILSHPISLPVSFAATAGLVIPTAAFSPQDDVDQRCAKQRCSNMASEHFPSCTVSVCQAGGSLCSPPNLVQPGPYSPAALLRISQAFPGRPPPTSSPRGASDGSEFRLSNIVQRIGCYARRRCPSTRLLMRATRCRSRQRMAPWQFLEPGHHPTGNFARRWQSSVAGCPNREIPMTAPLLMTPLADQTATEHVAFVFALPPLTFFDEEGDSLA